MPRDFLASLAAAALVVASAVAAPAQSENEDGLVRAHGYSFYGDLSYAEDFEYLRYVNPEAPKGA